ncbi:hypothetical protein SBA2_150011 [Acidobacteriia bacterium SbA2]|nr:hypothetical protein SBA2_150011 [Acidobacteriia bacterium SbA2]
MIFTAPEGATEITQESLPPLRGSDNHGLRPGPTAHAVGYSLTALRACISGRRDVHRYWR